LQLKINIKQNSFLAKIAAKKLKSKSVAMVLGKTIYLYGVNKNHFLKDKAWLAHEICHINQFAKHGFIWFIILYLWETLKSGYYNNKFEVEARQAEKDVSVINEYIC
jgi:hypothetical protein